MSEPSIAQVCVLGIGIVFVSLLSIVIMCYAIGFLSRLLDGKGNKTEPEKPVVTPVSRANSEIPNRQEFVAAVSAAIAESMDKDVSAIRILSIKKI